ncbi:MAG TPA: hypothetical protein VN364_14200 [Bellilinea sp.]|nr:hypothetical protein [Bellilinea sp.]
MRKVVFSILLLAGFLLVQAGCIPEFSPTAVEVTPSEVPISPPAANSDGALDVPAAMIIEGHTDATTASGGRPGMMTVSIVPVSAESGEPINGLEPILLGEGIFYGFSQDRSQMAVFTHSVKECKGFCLRIMDIRNWQEMTDPISLNFRKDAWLTVPTFDQDSRYIPLLVGGVSSNYTEVLLIDRSPSMETVKTTLDANVYQMTLTPDGNLAVYGVVPGSPTSELVIYTALLNGSNLQVLWEQTLPEIKLSDWDVTNHSDPSLGVYYDPARIFSPDGGKLYIVAADEPTLVTVDFQSRTTTSVKIEPKLSWLQKLFALDVRSAQAKMLNGIYKMGVPSPDGRYLFVVGQQSVATKKDNDEIEVDTVPLGLQVIDTQNGALVQQIETKANRLSLSPDGKSLFLNGWEMTGASEKMWTDVLDLSSWQVVQHLNGTVSPSRLSDGSQVWLVLGANSGSAYTADIYLPGDTSPRAHLTRTSYVDWVIVP